MQMHTVSSYGTSHTDLVAWHAPPLKCNLQCCRLQQLWLVLLFAVFPPTHFPFMNHVEELLIKEYCKYKNWCGLSSQHYKDFQIVATLWKEISTKINWMSLSAQSKCRVARTHQPTNINDACMWSRAVCRDYVNTYISLHSSVYFNYIANLVG